MLSDKPSAIQLSQVIAHVTAPSFLLGAVAAFISLLIARMNRIIDRSQALNAISDDDASRASLKSDIPRQKRPAPARNAGNAGRGRRVQRCGDPITAPVALSHYGLR